MLVIPSTKQIASRIFDFPEPFNPVMALKDSSNPSMVSFLALHVPVELTSDCRSDWIRLEACLISCSSGVVILGTHRPGLALRFSFCLVPTMASCGPVLLRMPSVTPYRCSDDAQSDWRSC
jgi:hypothetical protein